MESLVSFLNRDELNRHVSTAMSQILASQQEPSKGEKEVQSLSQLLDVLPKNANLPSIPIAGQLFDYLLQNAPSLDQYRLLASCLSLMTPDDRLRRIENILRTILDHEQTVALRELLGKLLSTIEPSVLSSLKIDWPTLESMIVGSHDPKFFIYAWRFLSKHYQDKLDEILTRALSVQQANEELLLLLLIDSRSRKAFVSMPRFWSLIQRSLGDSTPNNDRPRKCSLYLLKEILSREEFHPIEIKDGKVHRSLILITEKTKAFWSDFVVVYEALEDGVVHLIRPLLSKFDRLLNTALDSGLSMTWLFILLERLFANTSAPLGRWTMHWFLNSMALPDSQAEDFFLERVLDWSSNNFVFLKGDEINEGQSMEQCFQSYLERWLKSAEQPSRCLRVFLSRLQTIKWSQVSLVRVLHCLRGFALTHPDQVLLHDEHIQILSSSILTQFHTYAPVLRLSAYSSILDIVIHLLDWSISSTSTNLLRFFATFDRSTFLSKHFHAISSHYSGNTRQIQLSIEEFLAADSLISTTPTRVFSIDNDLLQSRQIAFLLDLLDPHNTDVLKTLFNPLLENIRTAYQRPYMSIDHVRRLIELFAALVQETYFHSINFVKEWLSSSLRSIVREGLNFIKMHAGKQPVGFAKLPVVFFIVGNHGDISRFLQELISQMEIVTQQQANDGWQSLCLLFAHSIHWLLQHRRADFHVEWETKYRLLPLFSKLLPLLDQNSNTIPKADMLIAKYLLIVNHLSSPGLYQCITDDFFKASPKELPYLFPALGLLLGQSEITNEEKCRFIESALVVINELDHRMPAYWPCLTVFCQAIAPSIIDIHLCHILTPWFQQMLDKCGHVSGMINVVLDSAIPIWLSEHRIQSSHLPILIDCILFGQTYQKDKKQQWQAEQILEQDESYRSLIVHTHTIPEYRYDRNVRIAVQLFLLHIWPSLPKAQQDELIKGIIEKHRRLAYKERRPRFCTNSLEHRLMFRSLQCLLCLTAVIKDSSLLKTIYDYVVETLIHENEPSLRLLAEWIVVRLILEDRETRLNDLYAYISDAHRHRTGTVCAWISIASHVTNLLSNHVEQLEYINRIIECLSPLLIHSNFHIRTFACSTMIKLLECIERQHLEKETLYQAYRWFKQTDEKSELGRYTAKLQSMFLYQFDPVRDFSLETIFYTLPKLSLLAEDEYLGPEWLMEISQHFHLTFPISVHNVWTILQSCQPGIWRLTAAGKSDLGGHQEEESSSMIQHKANPYPVVEALDDTELRANIQRTQLIVVASLIDKQANLGGLCRTGEIFGVKELVLDSIRILEDQQFLNLSMTAHKWLRIKQVQERELKEYLVDMQAQGYTIVAVEQTVNSQSLYQYEFPEKTLLLLGNEREGIRADLLSLVDVTVEIPQAGVIRSLNVHVSGALCISEYARKHLSLIK